MSFETPEIIIMFCIVASKVKTQPYDCRFLRSRGWRSEISLQSTIKNSIKDYNDDKKEQKTIFLCYGT